MPTRHHIHPVQATRAFVERHRLAAIFIVGGVLLAIAASVALYLYNQRPSAAIDTTPRAIKKPAAVKYYSPLTGVEVADQAATTQAVTAIMIENSPDARPQSGLKQAGIVYEAIAEGGITRFLAVYQESKPQLIGPVRSVRMYYIDWAAPYNASIAHVGGSAAALAEVRSGSYRDLDQFFHEGSYWRASDRYAPHNVYTSFAKLDALNASKNYTASTFTGFPRQDTKVPATLTAESIDIIISSTWYNTHYDYDATSNTYLRSVGGKPSNDREEGRLAPNVVIAMKVNMASIFEDGWREDITTSGSGVADIFQNGTVIEATWRKNSRTEQLEFLDTTGKPIALNRGQTWIAAVPNGSGDIQWQ